MTIWSRNPMPWTDILSIRFDDVTDEYGPHSHEVVSAFMTIEEIEWLQRVGEPITRSEVAIVHSWEEALTIFRGDRNANGLRRYNANGVLNAPCDRVDPIFEQIPEREAWWQKARRDAKPYSIFCGLPVTLSQELKDLVDENLYEFVSMLLAEIIGSPEANCTYFREQLSWFHAGHFPCGWEGDWPNGRMRVF